MTPEQVTTLFRAAFEDDAAAIHAAAANGADLNISASGTFLLRNACMADSLRALRALLELGADANKAFTYESPISGKKEGACRTLMYAASVEGARLLVEHGADVNAQDALGGTALMRMASFGNVELVEYLLQAGANPNMQKYPDAKLKRHTALSMAKDKLALFDMVPTEGRNEPAFEQNRLKLLRTVELLTIALANKPS